MATKYGVETSPATKKPTGLSIKRTNKKFEFSWKIASADHNAGQELKGSETYASICSVGDSDFTKKINKTQTSATHSINASDYYPNNPYKTLSKITFTIRGQRAKYEKEVTYNKKKHTVKIDPTWSAWVSKSFSINKPYEPIVSEELDQTYEFVTTFSWTSNISDSDSRMFTDYEWESVLTSGTAKANWSSPTINKHANGIDGDTGGADTGSATVNDVKYEWHIEKGSGYVIIRENSSVVSSGSHTRRFRIRSRGPGGASDWVDAKHVYAKPKAVQTVYYSLKDARAAIKQRQEANGALAVARDMASTVKFGLAGYSPDANHLDNTLSNIRSAALERRANANEKLNTIKGALMSSNARGGSGSIVQLCWKVDQGSGAYPIDYAQVQYKITVPVVTTKINSSKHEMTSTLSCPPGEDGWTNAPGGVIRDSAGFDRYSFVVDEAIAEDQMMFIRVNTIHDRYTTYGDIFEVVNSQEYLKDPTGLSIVESYDPETKRIKIGVPTIPSEGETAPNSFIVIYFRSYAKQDKVTVVGIIKPNETTTEQILTLPDINDGDTPGLGMSRMIGSYSPTNFTEVTTDFKVSPIWDSGNVIWLAGRIPMPPKVSVDPVEGYYDRVKVHWNWNFSTGNSAEVSWADHDDAWNSTDGPSTYEVSAVHNPDLIVAGLAPGKWFFRVRLIDTRDGQKFYGTYSSIKSGEIDISTSPTKPLLQADKYTVVAGDTFSLYWGYGNEDGTPPELYEIALYSVDSSGKASYTIFDKGRTTNYDQQKKLTTAKDMTHAAWPAGSVVRLAVRTASSAGKRSEWSDPVEIDIAPKLVAHIDSTSLSSKSISTYIYAITEDVTIVSGKTYYEFIDYEYVAVTNPVSTDLPFYYERELYTKTIPKALRSLPLDVTVSGSGTDGTVYATITRNENYRLDRPDLMTDEISSQGFEGETIAGVSRQGSGQLTITKDDLIGSLDDGQEYTLTVYITDSYGQTSAPVKQTFEVSWDWQAKMPTATVVANEDYLVSYITPIAPSNVNSGDRVDIYRLSADKPELIVQGGRFGTTYVDPYPTLGNLGGHRVVYITKDGDFITANNTLAMRDYDRDDDDYFDDFGIVIDFAREQIRLPYNVSVSNKWQKDFTEVKYLGGSVQGYWNPAVSRTASLKTDVVIDEDVDETGVVTLKQMRRLAAYPGICHVRTPDGSSYAANVTISEDREEKFVRRLVKFNIEITRVESESLDGMTLEEWADSRGGYDG